MTKIQKILLGLSWIMFLIAGVLIGHKLWYMKPITSTSGDYFKSKDFKPDTVIIAGEDIHDTIYPKSKYPTQLPPKVVIQYGDYKYSPDDTIHKTPNTFTVITHIDSPFLKYKGYDHLIYGEISKDSIRLDLQNGSGVPFTRIYIADFSKYKYQILNNGLNVKELNTPRYDYIAQKEKSFRYNGTYLNGGYEKPNNSYSFGAETSIQYKRFKIMGYGILPLNPIKSTTYTVNTNFVYGVRLGYRLF